MSSLSYSAAAFDPEGRQFAAAYKALDGYRVRVSAVQSDAPAVEYACAKGIQITSLLWINVEKTKQSRKRIKADSASPLHLALGTSAGTVLIYFPAANEVKHSLGAVGSAVVSLASRKGSLYALYANGTFAEWDVVRNTQTASDKSPVADAQLVSPFEDNLLLASTQPYLVNDSLTEIVSTFPGFASPITQVVSSSSDFFAAIAEDDRQIQVYKQDNTSSPFNSLMCPSSVVAIALSTDESALSAVTEDGLVHVFAEPFANASSDKSTGRRSKGPRSAKPAFSITIQRPSGESVAVQRTRFNDDFLTLVWSEQGAVPVFERVQWRQDGEIASTDDIVLVRNFSAPKAAEHLVNGRDAAAAPVYKEGNANITSGHHVGDLEMEEDEEDQSDDGEGDETLADRLEALEVQRGAAPAEEDVSEKASKPTKMKLSTPGSFAVLLNQALAADDKQLLETCLSERDEKMVKSSIIKLEPPLAAKLLEKLAERMARSQHRSGQLTLWIKWVIVVHGGYLVTVPNLLKSLASLHATLANRVSTLPRLLALQGRLNLLNDQIEVRREISDATREIEDADDVPEAVYTEEPFIVNGEEDFEDAEGSEVEIDDEEEVDEDDDDIHESEDEDLDMDDASDDGVDFK